MQYIETLYCRICFN